MFRFKLNLFLGWFYPERADLLVPHSGNHSIYAASYAPTPYLAKNHDEYRRSAPRTTPTDYFRMVWNLRDHSVHAWDVTRRYKKRVKSHKTTHLRRSETKFTEDFFV